MQLSKSLLVVLASLLLPAAACAQASPEGVTTISPQYLRFIFLTAIGSVFIGLLCLLVIPLFLRQWQLRRMRKAITVVRGDLKLTAGRLPLDERDALEAPLIRTGRWSRTFWSPFLNQWRGLYDETTRRAEEPLDFLDFCTPERVIPGIANRRLASVTPGILVSLGILGTFTGLWFGLPEASADGMNVGNESIETLIAGLGTALTSSLLGIGCSVVFLALDRIAMHGLERGVRRLRDVVAEFYPSIPAAEARRAQAKELLEATQQLKTLATDIAVALEQSMGSVMTRAVGDAMEQKVAPAIEELRGVIATLSTTVSGDMVQALNDFSTQINANISDALKGSFEALTANVAAVVDSQEKMLGILTLAGDRMQEQAQIQERLTTQVTNAAESLEGVLVPLGEIATRLQSASEAVGVATTQLSTVSEEVGDRHREIVDAQRDLSAQLHGEFERLKEARNSILESWKAVAADARASVAIVQDAAADLGRKTGDALVVALERFDGKLAEVTERYSGTLGEVNETIHELPTHVAEIAASSKAMSTATTTLRDELHGIVESMNSSVGNAAERAVVAAEQLASVTEQAGKVATQFTETIEQYSQSASGQTAGLADLSAKVQECVKALGEASGQMAGLPDLSAKVQACAEALGDLTTSLADRGAGGKSAIASAPAPPQAPTTEPGPVSPSENEKTTGSSPLRESNTPWQRLRRRLRWRR
jgi:ABC-type transporter Mla subunit MlaD